MMRRSSEHQKIETKELSPPIRSPGEIEEVSQILESFPRRGTPEPDYSFHAQARATLQARLRPGEVIAVNSAPRRSPKELVTSRPRQASTFYYLTGIEKAEGYSLVLTRDSADLIEPFGESFREVCTRACKSGLSLANNGKLQELGPQLRFLGPDTFSENCDPRLTDGRSDELFMSVLNDRLTKGTSELARLARAAMISAHAHKTALRYTAKNGVGVSEAEIRAAFEYSATSAGASGLSYQTIVTSSLNEDLHDQHCSEIPKNGDLVRIDGAASYGRYGVDMTTSWPISGRFSTHQKLLYNHILATLQGAQLFTKPGVTLDEISRCIQLQLSRIIKELFLSTTRIDEAIQALPSFSKGPYAHFVGLDVHDGVELPGYERIPLKPGMVIAIEPYITLNDRNLARCSSWPHMTIQLENTFLITEQGAAPLVQGVLQSPEHIEHYMSQHKA